jgi:putative membrane protein
LPTRVGQIGSIRDVGFIWRTLAGAAGLWVAVWIVDGFEFSGDAWEFIVVALILGVANAVVKPILRLFSLPLILLTLGLFLLVVNALVLSFVVWLSEVFELGLTSEGFFWVTFLAAIVVSIVSWIVGAVLPED